MQNNKYPSVRRNNLVVQEISDELMIYDLNENKAFCLNETSAKVWQLCDGKKSLGQISKELGRQLNTSPDVGLVWLALNQLKINKLLENSADIEDKYLGMSRREVIKKVGFGTMIALPLVSSIVAPTSANAASGPLDFCNGMGSVGFVGVCTMNSDCGQFIQPPPFDLCCRLAAFGARVCIIKVTSGVQCDCTQP